METFERLLVQSGPYGVGGIFPPVWDTVHEEESAILIQVPENFPLLLYSGCVDSDCYTQSSSFEIDIREKIEFLFLPS